ncbi:GD21952 [Drosophila simulans]|uniref:GD21952 n=1 Tax=Drosophila simulans TaxID=7240 RepID=B4Q6F9_DROSI|nr:GD21952 [Drosophila simulans]
MIPDEYPDSYPAGIPPQVYKESENMGICLSNEIQRCLHRMDQKKLLRTKVKSQIAT